MIVRLLLVAALVALLAGCGSSGHQAAPPPPKPKTKPKPKPPHHSKGPHGKLRVTILDGDRRKRVRGARVRLDGKSERTDRHGDTEFKAPRRRFAVSVSAKGYSPATFRVNFRHRKWQTLRIYQPDLQWPVYGATKARTQAPTDIRLRPPFRLIWSRGLGHLIEFPAVVWNGFAYIGSQYGTVQAVSMRSGKIVWRHDTPGAPRMASSPAVDGEEVVYHTMGGHVYVLDRLNGHVKWSYNAGSAIESSPVVVHGIDYFGTAGGQIYALDLRRHKLRWSRSLGAKITSSAAIEHGRLFIGDYAGRLWALSPATARPAGPGR